MRRRDMPLLALPLLARPALAAPGALRFRIMREGSAIGTHTVTLTEADGALSARTLVAIQVKIMGITVFRLTHDFTEVWSGGRLASVTSRHDRNGTVVTMSARADAGGLAVQGPAGAARLPAEAAPLSWWDSRRFNGPLFDNETGKPLSLQWSRSALAGGATRWRATGDTEGEATYSADGTWLDWKTKGDDGSLVTYERILMGLLRVVLGDQLTREIPSLVGLDPAADVVLLAEVMGECTYVPHHKQKLVLVLSAMRHFAAALAARGVRVDYIKLDDPANSGTPLRRGRPRRGPPPARGHHRHPPRRVPRPGRDARAGRRRPACRSTSATTTASSATSAGSSAGPRAASSSGWSISTARCAAPPAC